MNGTKSSQTPGYGTMAPLGVHTFVVFALFSLPRNSYKMDRLKVERELIRTFQPRGNAPYCHRIGQTSQGTDKLTTYVKPTLARKPLRCKRIGLPLQQLPQQCLRAATIQTFRDHQLHRIEHIRTGLMRQENQAKRAMKKARTLTNKELDTINNARNL